jgi:hypothetical protein
MKAQCHAVRRAKFAVFEVDYDLIVLNTVFKLISILH